MSTCAVLRKANYIFGRIGENFFYDVYFLAQGVSPAITIPNTTCFVRQT